MGGEPLACSCALDSSISEACPPSPSLGWLSPRTSVSRDFPHCTAKSDAKNGSKEKGDRDSSMSEFEFAMSMLDIEDSANTHMLAAADDLFLEGKLLPMYTPQYIKSPQQPLIQGELAGDRKEVERQQQCGRKCMEKVVPVDLSGNSLVVKEVSHMPASPKMPGCSTKWRELLGLKKVKPQCLQDACKRHPKHAKTADLQSKTSMASRAMRLFCRSNSDKLPVVRISTSEPHMTCGRGDAGAAQRRVASIHTAQIRGVEDKITLAGHSSLAVSIRGGGITEYGPNTNYDDGVGPHVRDFNIRPQRTVSSRRGMSYDEMKLESYGGRAMMRERWYGETSPSRRSSGAVSPAGSSGRWSPGRHSSGGWGSPGRGTYSPKRGSLGNVSPGRLSFGESTEVRRLLRAGSLERSNSYSSKSLQRKYDPAQTMRQRDGRRILERSCSYNMNSVRVSPVLNVPVVCLMRSKNSNNSNTNSGLGQRLFYSKATSTHGNFGKKG